MANVSLVKLAASWQRRESSEVSAALYASLVELVRQQIRSTLFGRVNPYIDVDDVVQEVFIALFRALRYGLVPLTTDRQLAGWTRRLAENVAMKQNRYFTRQKRDVRRQQLFAASDFERALADRHHADDASSRELTLSEAFERLDGQSRSILQMLLSGCSRQEVADRHGMVTRSLRRKLLAIKGTLCRHGISL